MNVVSNDKVSNECVLKCMWYQMKKPQINRSQMNVVSNKCGLK